MSHPMFASAERTPDGPSEDELARMRSMKSFTSIDADSLRDPDWYMNEKINGASVFHKGKKLASEQSQYDVDNWNGTTDAQPSRVQKRKHQINWLANEAIEKEA